MFQILVTNVNETADSTINTNSPTTELTTASNPNTEKILPNISHIYIHFGNVSGIGSDDLSSHSDSANSSNSDDDDHHNGSAASNADSGTDEDSGDDSAGVNGSSGNQSESGSMNSE